MSSQQQILSGQQVTTAPTQTATPQLGFEHPESHRYRPSPNAPRVADWVVFTGRYPYVFDALRLGFAIGRREDNSYQWTPDEVTLPVHFLDNDYADPSLGRFVDKALNVEPEIAVLGDIYDADALDKYLAAAETLWASLPDLEIILVPKTDAVLGEIPTEFVLGFPNGTSPVQWDDIGDYTDWRQTGNRIHILGGTPTSTQTHIEELTKPTVTGLPSADIAGIDWNGYQKFAENYGDYAAADGGWCDDLRNEYPAARDLIRYSLLNAKHHWLAQGVWPTAPTADLPSRETLLEADRSGQTGFSQRDCRTLATSPRRHTSRQNDPLCRTDNTQTEVIEPLSAIATFLYGHTATWEPAGRPTTAGTFDAPMAFPRDNICAGCGHDLFRSSNRESLSATIVSYEHRGNSTAHYDSVPQNGPSSLTDSHPDGSSLYSSVYAFCSEACQDRTEHRSSDELLPDHDHNAGGIIEGVTLGEVVYSSSREEEF